MAEKCLFIAIFVLLLFAPGLAVDHIPGDIDEDGDVDFSDFLILAQNFGKGGGAVGPRTVTITLRDTVTQAVRDTVWVTAPGTTTSGDIYETRTVWENPNPDVLLPDSGKLEVVVRWKKRATERSISYQLVFRNISTVSITLASKRGNGYRARDKDGFIIERMTWSTQSTTERVALGPNESTFYEGVWPFTMSDQEFSEIASFSFLPGVVLE